MNRVVENKLKHIIITDSWGFNEKVAPKLLSLLNNFNPFFLQFLSPLTFIVFFEQSFPDNKIKIIIDQIIICLKENSLLLENTIVRFSEVNCIYELDSNNRPVKAPFGDNAIFIPSNIVYEQKT